MSEAELYDYDALRRESAAIMFVPRVSETTLVLGGHQPSSVLRANSGAVRRRRRGGGGVVLLAPGDLWVDWWLPRGDARWSDDLRASARMVGGWWRSVLAERWRGEVLVHDGPADTALALRVVCFAGRGPGEVFLDGRKAVGLTQWRVREGIFLSSVLSVGSPAEVLAFLERPSPELAAALDQRALNPRELGHVADLSAALAARSGGPEVRRPRLGGAPGASAS